MQFDINQLKNILTPCGCTVHDPGARGAIRISLTNFRTLDSVGKVETLAEAVLTLMEAGIPREHITCQFTFKATQGPQAGQLVELPGIWLNPEARQSTGADNNRLTALETQLSRLTEAVTKLVGGSPKEDSNSKDEVVHHEASLT